MARATERHQLIAALVEQGLSDREIAERLDLTRYGVRAFRRNRAIGSRHRPADVLQRPAPADFASAVAGLSLVEITRLYRCRYSVARRWLSECGMRPAPPAPRRDKPRRQIKGVVTTRQPEDRAADHLRRRFTNVFRCSIRLKQRSLETYGDWLGLPDHGNGWWHIATVGNIRTADMIALAQQHGWEG